MASLVDVSSSISTDYHIHIHETNKLTIPFPLLEQLNSVEKLVLESYEHGLNLLISALVQLVESSASEFWSTLQYNDASINMMSSILESFPRPSDGLEEGHTWQLKTIYKLAMSIFLRVCSTQSSFQITVNGDITARKLDEISPQLRMSIAERLFDLNNFFALIVVYWKENSQHVLEIINFMSHELDHYCDAVIESIPSIFDITMKNLGRLNKSHKFKVTAAADNDKRIVEDYSNIVHFVFNMYEEFTTYIKAIPRLAVVIVQDKSLLRRLLKLSYKITDLVFNHLSQDSLVRRFGFHNRLLSRCLLLDWQAANFLRLLLEYSVMPQAPPFENEAEQQAYDNLLCSKQLLTLDRSASCYLDIMEHLLKHCPKVSMYYKREFSFEEDILTFGHERNNAIDARFNVFIADFQRNVNQYARMTMKAFRKKRILKTYDEGTWSDFHKSVAENLNELLGSQMFGPNFIRFFTFMMAPTVFLGKEEEVKRMKLIETLTIYLVEWRAPVGRQNIPHNILMLFTAADDIFAPKSEDEEPQSIGNAVAQTEEEHKDLKSITHGKKHGAKLKPINEELNNAQELRAFYKQFDEVASYQPIEKGIDYSLMYDDERDDTYDDVDAGEFDDLDQDSKMFIVHRLNEALPDTDKNDDYNEETELPAKGSSASTQNPPSITLNPSAYTGGRQRQLKEKRDKHNQRNRADQKRNQGFR